MRCAPGIRIAALALAAFAIVAPVASSAHSTAAKATAVKVTIHDTGFALSLKKAPEGEVVFSVQNLGTKKHDFSVDGKKTTVLAHGKKAKLVVTFKKAGSFRYTSTVAGDAKLEGTFVVTVVKPVMSAAAMAGKRVFQSNCVACHTLKAAGATGTIGPNLDNLKLTAAFVASTVTNGKNGSAGTMPPFKGTLTSTQITDVAAFVSSAESS